MRPSFFRVCCVIDDGELLSEVTPDVRHLGELAVGDFASAVVPFP
jgi:hypothetical protein